MEMVMSITLVFVLGLLLYLAGEDAGRVKAVREVQDYIRISKNYEDFVELYNIIWRSIGGK